GRTVWLDAWQNGTTLSALAAALALPTSTVGAAIIFIGDHGLGGWQSFEARLFARAYFERSLRLVLALLPRRSVAASEVPWYLETIPLVDLAAQGKDPVAAVHEALDDEPSVESREAVRRIVEEEEGRGG